jgi:large subunit ribosomal protein L18
MKGTAKKILRKKRQLRIRKRISGTAKRPRLSVFRSNRHLSVQLIDDEKGNVLAAVSDVSLKGKLKGLVMASSLGKAIAKLAKDQGALEAVFDRRGYKYHGLVKAIAEGAREGGLKF